jgi:hypothetical protein
MLRIRTSVIRGLRALFPHALTRGKGATIPLTSILHIACCAPTLLIASRLRCPAYREIVDITFNHAHHWWFFTSWQLRHNCIILRIRAIRTFPYRKRNTRLRWIPAKGHLTDHHVTHAQEGVLLRELIVSIPLMVGTCTCLAINMYHYRYQERTPNTTSLSKAGDPTVAPSKEVNKCLRYHSNATHKTVVKNIKSTDI